MRRMCWAALAACALTTPVFADSTIRTVRVDPPALQLRGPHSSYSLLVEGETAEGRSVDLTHDAEYRSFDPRIGRVTPGGVVHAVGDGATLVKLLRVAMLLPVVVLFAHLFRASDLPVRDGAESVPSKRSSLPPALPGFLVAFVVLVALNSVGFVPEVAAKGLGEVSRWCLVTAIAAIGVKTSVDQLAEVGWQPVLMIVLESLWIAAIVLGSVLAMRSSGG